MKAQTLISPRVTILRQTHRASGTVSTVSITVRFNSCNVKSDNLEIKIHKSVIDFYAILWRCGAYTMSRGSFYRGTIRRDPRRSRGSCRIGPRQTPCSVLKMICYFLHNQPMVGYQITYPWLVMWNNNLDIHSDNCTTWCMVEIMTCAWGGSRYNLRALARAGYRLPPKAWSLFHIHHTAGAVRSLRRRSNTTCSRNTCSFQYDILWR